MIGASGFFIWNNLQPKPETITAENTKQELPGAETIAQDPYEGWGTYESIRDGYTLRYPANWIVINETVKDGPYIRNMPFTGGGYPEGYINLRVLRDVGTVSGSNLTPEAWYAALGTETVQKGPVTFAPDTVKDFRINGLDAKNAKSVFSEIDEDIFILRGDALYEINMYPYGISENANVKKILNSFTYI